MADILVVEDEADIRELIVFQLGHDGHEVRAVADGTAALDAVASRLPDVIVLDWGLPKLPGPQVCRRVRAMPGAGRIGVLMLTVRITDAEVAECLAAGADEFMAKPFDLNELRARIDALLARSRGGS
ncbi:response regulator transcription factor [Planomonospora venezuelensis]|uniref:DNA-binding response OmpR family regulator n=1 Tax=Planomonospora venezuelensis TaxID=1999 RepID=A0A841D0B3_PLAVE|nr:response regulator transcription factor [Planomonospora venezuelensis]MBB5962453.1 DNA-binding response OmpR family regulator [Planomonospora venezuelensis]